MTTSRDVLPRDLVHPGPVLPLGGQRRSLRLAGLPGPAARARAFTGTALAEWSWPAPHLGQDIVLLVTELVANAARHAGGPLEIALEASETRLRIEVSDGSRALPALQYPHRPGLPGGHGLFIVQQTADRWGVERHGAGKTVWAEIASQTV